MRCLGLLLPGLPLLLLLGCTDNALENRLEDYNTRLERVLEHPPGLTMAPAKPMLPPKRALLHDIPAVDIDLFEFLKLGDCALQSAIAEKNSSLGKFAAASVALEQDVTFILLVEQCLTMLEDEQLIQTLESALSHKLRYLDQRAWNAIFAAEEYREFWSQMPDDYPASTESRLPFALSALQKNLNALKTREDLTDFDAKEFEAALQILRSGEAAALLNSWHLVLTHLSRGTSIVSGRASARPLCFEGMRNPKADIFRNLVLDKFIAGLQKDIAVLNQRYYEVIVPLQALEQVLQDVQTPAYEAFRLSRDETFLQGLETVRRHVAAVEPLMVQCGFIPEA